MENLGSDWSLKARFKPYRTHLGSRVLERVFLVEKRLALEPRSYAQGASLSPLWGHGDARARTKLRASTGESTPNSALKSRSRLNGYPRIREFGIGRIKFLPLFLDSTIVLSCRELDWKGGLTPFSVPVQCPQDLEIRVTSEEGP